MGLTKTLREFFFYFCIRVLVQKNPARTTPLASAVLPTKVISVCVPLDSRVGLARKVKYVCML